MGTRKYNNDLWKPNVFLSLSYNTLRDFYRPKNIKGSLQDFAFQHYHENGINKPFTHIRISDYMGMLLGLNTALINIDPTSPTVKSLFLKKLEKSSKWIKVFEIVQHDEYYNLMKQAGVEFKEPYKSLLFDYIHDEQKRAKPIEKYFEQYDKLLDGLRNEFLEIINNFKTGNFPTVTKSVKERGIIFNNTETIVKLLEGLKGYFTGHEADLKKILNNEPIKTKLIFPHNQNKLVEVFRRLQYNSLCNSNATELRDWLCNYFQFHYVRGTDSETRDLKPSTVWDLLTKARGEPKSSKQRICNFDWLPYKTPEKVKEP